MRSYYSHIHPDREALEEVDLTFDMKIFREKLIKRTKKALRIQKPSQKHSQVVSEMQ